MVEQLILLRLGSNTLTYRAIDNAGNSSEVTRVINIVDIESPVITMVGNANITLDLYQPYNELGASATDNYDNNVSVVTTGSVNTSAAGVYTITYTATDTSGNIATSVRTITVVNNIKPIITILGDNPITSDVTETFNDPELQQLMD